MRSPLKVLINAQIPQGGWCGGIEQFLMGFVYGLGRLTDGDEKYCVIVGSAGRDWLRPLLGPNQEIVTPPGSRESRFERAKRLLGPLRKPAGEFRRDLQRFLFDDPNRNSLPQSDGFFESLGGDVIHFPYQTFTRCSMPSIYNPHDLQHLHYPKFFSKRDVEAREATYQPACRHAEAVVAPSRAVKSDLQKSYGLDARRVFVIHQAAPVSLYEPTNSVMLEEIRRRLGVPGQFAFFPAQTWPHKNHLRLLEAVRLLFDRHGVKLNLVCTGRQNEYWPVIRQHIAKLKLEPQVNFLGFVSPSDLRALYYLAHFVVFPSLFEGAGMPVIEGLQEGVPVACSDIAPLREYGGDAVLGFDPHSVDSIATSLLRISRDRDLREQLQAKGKERVRLFTWERTARAYRALYRQVAGTALEQDDLRLLTSSVAA